MEEELFDIAQRMAEDLREYADAAAESGSTQVATEALLGVWDIVAAKYLGMAP